MPTVRPARLDDDAALVAIDRAVWSPVHSPAPAPPAPDATIFHPPRVSVGGTLVLVADDGHAAGWIAIHQPIPVRAAAHVREISGLAVAPDHQGQGLAALLLDAAAELARREGATRLTLRCLSTNVLGQSVYERYGFLPEGCLHGEFVIDGRPVDDLLYALDIGHTATART